MTRTSLRWGLAVALGVCTLVVVPVKAQQAGFVLFPQAPTLALNPGGAAGPVSDEHVFVHPVTGPYFQEDSFNSTDLRLWYVYHSFSNSSAFTGGHAQVAAAQVRVAITNDIQLVAYKDGFTMLDPGNHGLGINHDGWNDVAAGLKWEFLKDDADQLYAAGGVGYQFPWGESKVLQNKEELRVWASANKGFDKLHLGGTFNYFFHTGNYGPLGASDHLAAFLHGDYYVCKMFSPVVETSFYRVTKQHNAALPLQGADVTSLGGGLHDNIWTFAVGAEIRPVDHVALRAAWEKNVAHPNTDIFDWRITASAVISF